MTSDYLNILNMQFYIPGSRLGHDDVESSLLDLSLVPASLLNFCWDPEIEADLARSGQAGQLAYLRPELKQ